MGKEEELKQQRSSQQTGTIYKDQIANSIPKKRSTFYGTSHSHCLDGSLGTTLHSAYPCYRKFRWPKSQKHSLLGFFLLSLMVCLLKPCKFRARQSYRSNKSSSFTSAILKTVFTQASPLLKLWFCPSSCWILGSLKSVILFPLSCHWTVAKNWAPFPKQAEQVRFVFSPISTSFVSLCAGALITGNREKPCSS